METVFTIVKGVFMKFRWIVLVLLLLAAGCMFRLVYNHLDWIIPWYVSDFIDLDNNQSSDLERRLISLLTWHRGTQLNAYAQTLSGLKPVVQRGLQRDDLDRTHLTLRGHWQDLVREISPDMAQILAGATDAQLKELCDHLDKRGEKFKEKYIDQPAEDLRRKKIERMEKFLDFWLGTVTSEQEAIVDDWSRRLVDIAPARLNYMQQMRSRFRTILTRRKDIPRFTEELRDLLFFDRNTWPADFKSAAEQNREWTKTVFLKIDQSLTDDQRRHFVEKLDELVEMLEDMAAEET